MTLIQRRTSEDHNGDTPVSAESLDHDDHSLRKRGGHHPTWKSLWSSLLITRRIRTWFTSGLFCLAVFFVFLWNSSGGGSRRINVLGLITAQHDIDHSWGSFLHPFRLNVQNLSSPQPGILKARNIISTDVSISTRYNDIGMKTVCIAVGEFLGLMKNGGIGTAYYELARLLAAQKDEYNVTLLFLQGKKVFHGQDSEMWDYWLNHYRDIGITLIPLPAGVPVYPSWASDVSFRALQFLNKEENRFDIIHWADNTGLAYYPLLAKSQGWALQNTINIITFHGPDAWARLLSKQFPQDRFNIEVAYYEKRSCELADIILSPSEYMVHYLQKRGWRLDQPVYIVPNLVNLASMNLKSSTDVSQDGDGTFELVFYGRLEPRKGVDVFLRALDALAQTSPETLKLIRQVTFMGRSLVMPDRGPMGVWIRSYHRSSLWTSVPLVIADRFGREEAIHYLTDVQFRLAVIPSLNENSPYTVLECIAAGVKFIASAVGGIPELIHPDDRREVLFQPNPTALAAFLKVKLSASSFQSIRPAIDFEDVPTRYLDIHRFLAEGTAAAEAASIDLDNLPLVSVCVSHYERPDLVMQSLYALTVQTYPKDLLQVILIDDGSPSAATKERLESSVIPFVKSQGWKYMTVPNSYLGAVRNRAAEHMTGKFFLFLDDDDVIKPDFVMKMVQIARRTGNHVLSSFFDEFESMEQPLSMTESQLDALNRRVYAFAGPSLSLALLTNCIGGANIFVEQTTYRSLGGFTELISVGGEDYEFLMNALVHGVSMDIVPDPLIFIRSQVRSMKKQMDFFMSDYRALLPVLNSPQYSGITDFVMLSRGLQAQINQLQAPNALTVTDSARDFSSRQGQNGWYNLFAELNPKTGNKHIVRYFPMDNTLFHFDHQWLYAETSTKWPYIGKTESHPHVDPVSGVGIATVRRFVSGEEGDMILSLSVQGGGKCGDGIFFNLTMDQNQVLLSMYANDGAMKEIQLELTLHVGTIIELIVSPLSNDWCDGTVNFVQLMALGSAQALTDDEEAFRVEKAKRSKTIASFSAEALTDRKLGWTVGYLNRNSTTAALSPVVTTFDDSRKSVVLADPVDSKEWPYISDRILHPHVSADGTAYLPVISYTFLESRPGSQGSIEVAFETASGKNGCGDGVQVSVVVDGVITVVEQVVVARRWDFKSSVIQLDEVKYMQFIVDPLQTSSCDGVIFSLAIGRV